MSSVAARPGSLERSDQTARARIRDAALALFGRDGFDATSVRRVAQQAGVSAALVIHHYGSKAGLRVACDRYVTTELIESGKEELERDLVGTIRAWLSDPSEHRPALDYLARMLSEEGSAAGARLFDALLAQTSKIIDDAVRAGEMRASSDPEALAVVLATHAIAPLLLGGHVGRAFGRDGLDGAALGRYTLPVLEIYTRGLYRSSEYLDAVASVTGADA